MLIEKVTQRMPATDARFIYHMYNLNLGVFGNIDMSRLVKTFNSLKIQKYNRNQISTAIDGTDPNKTREDAHYSRSCARWNEISFYKKSILDYCTKVYRSSTAHRTTLFAAWAVNLN